MNDLNWFMKNSNGKKIYLTEVRTLLPFGAAMANSRVLERLAVNYVPGCRAEQF